MRTIRKLKKYKPTEFKAKTSVYDKDSADYAVMFIESLCHTKGTWAGKPFELIDWQEQIIRDIFGTLKPNGYRQFNTAYIEIPKKMGKSELAAAVALLLTCGDGEERAEVYGCAADRQQASIVFEVAADMVRMCPALNKRVKILTATKRIIYTPTMPNSTVILPPSDVLHIPGLGFDGLVGYSPIAMAKNSIGMAIACEEYGARFFSNGAAPGGVLEHPGTVKEPQKIRDSWNKSFMGTPNSHRIAVLEEGMKYTPIGISPNEAQFLETRKFQINEIARIFRVPPHMVGDLEKSSFSNIEQQSLEFVKYTLDPWVSRWEQSMIRSLLLPDEKKEYYIKFNVDGLLRGDYQSRMNGYATARQNGWMSANDIRELENLDRIPKKDGGDLYLVNGNMLPLENITKHNAYFDEDTQKEEQNEDEEILELDEPNGQSEGERQDAFSERNNRRRELV